MFGCHLPYYCNSMNSWPLTEGNHSLSTCVVHLLVVDTPEDKRKFLFVFILQPTWHSSQASHRADPCCHSVPWLCERRNRKSCPSSERQLEPDQQSVSCLSYKKMAPASHQRWLMHQKCLLGFCEWNILYMQWIFQILGVSLPCSCVSIHLHGVGSSVGRLNQHLLKKVGR